MTSMCSVRSVVRIGLHVAGAVAIAATLIRIYPASADTAVAAASSQRLVPFRGAGSVTVVPHSDSPEGCLAAGKGVCTAKYQGTETATLFPGVGDVRGDFTIDFTKPESSGAGTCFPELINGTTHTVRGDYRHVEQGSVCIPAASAGLPPGFNLQTRPGIFIGTTGALAHLYATVQVSISGSPGLILFQDIGVATGVENRGE